MNLAAAFVITITVVPASSFSPPPPPCYIGSPPQLSPPPPPLIIPHIIHLTPPLKYPSHHSPTKSIAKEEQCECMEKLFLEMQGKNSSSGVRQCKIMRSTLTLVGDKWDVGGGGGDIAWG